MAPFLAHVFRFALCIAVVLIVAVILAVVLPRSTPWN